MRLWGTKRYTGRVVPASAPTSSTRRPSRARRSNCHASTGAPGFTATDTRVIKDAASGREVCRHTRTVRYNPQPKITCDPS